MQIRKNALEKDHYYHIYSRSIAGYEIFNDASDYLRMIELFDLYRHADFEYKYSAFCDLTCTTQATIISRIKKSKDLLVEIIAYCIMPTHVHLILKQTKKKGISKYMARVLNSYSRYFNTRHKRQGPLWSGRFKSVLIENDEQLLHLTRYIHLNPTSAGIAVKINDWKFSSLFEYTGDHSRLTKLCDIEGLFDFDNKQYIKFVTDRKSYQRDLSIIKSHLIDNYSG